MDYSLFATGGVGSLGAAGCGRGGLGALTGAGFGSGFGGAGGGLLGYALPREPRNSLPRFVRLSPLPMR